MSKRLACLAAAGIVGAVLFGIVNRGNGRMGRVGIAQAAEGPGDSHDADVQAIRKAAREFEEAFAKGDAKTCSAFWTEQGEYQQEGSEPLLGRATIEKAFAEFFKDNPKSKVEIRIESIRFPSPDLAIEEGLLRNIPGGKGLPTSSYYSAYHVRDGGTWKMAVSREWGAGHDRLEDLEWLLGTWQGSANGEETEFSFTHGQKKNFIAGRYTQKSKGAVTSSGTIRIAIDPQRDQLRSWQFADDGNHTQALWLKDGNRWVLDVIGTMADGAATESVNLLIRSGKDAFTFQSIDHEINGQSLPDAPPIRLTRVTAAK